MVEDVQKLISISKPDKAIQLINASLKAENKALTKTYTHEVILLSSNLYRAKKEKNMSILTREEYDVALSRINASLLVLVDQIAASDTTEAIIPTDKTIKERVANVKKEVKLDGTIKILIFLLVGLFVVGIFYASIFVTETSDRILVITLSLAGLLGSGFGYYYWKLVELRFANPQPVLQ